MAKKSYALQPWAQYSDSKMETDAPIAVDQILAIPELAGLSAEATAAKDQVKNFETLLAAARLGGRSDIQAKNDQKGIVATSMNNLSVGVNNLAKGNRTLLVSTTLPINKISASAPVEQLKPEGVNVVAGKSGGQALVSVMAAQGAVSLMYQYTTEPVTSQSIWVSHGGGKSKSYLFSNLPVGVKVWFRVVSVGRNQIEIISDMVSLFIN